MTAPAYVSQEEINEEVSVMPEAQKAQLRDAAKHDLYVMAKGVLGYKDVNPKTHGGFCRFFQSNPKLRRLGLLPRDHLKSTIATISDSIRLSVRDPDEERIGIAGETSTTAEKFLSEIKGHWERGILLRQLFPELVPSKFSGPGVKWNSNEACLNRKTSYKELTYTAFGVGGAVTGSHFTRLKCDDLIGLEAKRSSAVMLATIQWANNLEPLLTNTNKDVIDFIGTRWLKHDLYAHIMKRYGPMLAVFTRQAIENGEVIFPEKHNMEVYENMLLTTPDVWYSQYCNNPQSDSEGDMPSGMIGVFKFTLDGQGVILNPGRADEKHFELADLDKVITADPNSGDKRAPDQACLTVTGVTPDDEALVLKSRPGRMSPSEFVDAIYEEAKRWKVRVVGIEKAGQQNTQHYFDKKAELEDFYIRVVALKPRGIAKEERVRAALEPVVRSGRLYTLPTQTNLRVLIESFPDIAKHEWDEIDCLAYGPDLWRKPMGREDQEETGKVLNMMLHRRNKRTGY